eukprot:comp22394_c0_seq1/m.33416 comp22394_c0_seq1/g.33416  ORF comp22394_c0_seq1/g.33416 comp22394_c0_seq1/m.33416 type:complete len:281 (-) comp22394_c0_seq1:86-928(-)
MPMVREVAVTAVVSSAAWEVKNREAPRRFADKIAQQQLRQQELDDLLQEQFGGLDIKSSFTPRRFTDKIALQRQRQVDLERILANEIPARSSRAHIISQTVPEDDHYDGMNLESERRSSVETTDSYDSLGSNGSGYHAHTPHAGYYEHCAPEAQMHDTPRAYDYPVHVVKREEAATPTPSTPRSIFSIDYILHGDSVSEHVSGFASPSISGAATPAKDHFSRERGGSMRGRARPKAVEDPFMGRRGTSMRVRNSSLSGGGKVKGYPSIDYGTPVPAGPYS